MEQFELKEIVLAEKRAVPQCNWPNFDVETEDYIEAIMEEPDRFDEFTTALWKRIQKFKKNDLSHLPPVLLRLEHETAAEWLNRCYKAGGYSGGGEI